MMIMERFDRDGDRLTITRQDTSVVTISIEGEHEDREQAVVVETADMIGLAYELLRVSGADSDEVTAAIELLRPFGDTTQSDAIIWSAQ